MCMSTALPIFPSFIQLKRLGHTLLLIVTVFVMQDTAKTRISDRIFIWLSYVGPSPTLISGRIACFGDKNVT